MGFLSSVRRAALTGAVLLGISAVNSAHADSFTVTNINDAGAGSLRQAILDANGNANPAVEDTITFASNVTGTINLTTIGDTTSGNSAFILKEKLKIVGPGADQLTVQRDASVASLRLFYLPSGATATLSGLTLKNGKTSNDGGAINCSGSTLTVQNSTIANNKSTFIAGALFSSSSTVTIQNSTITNNMAGTIGGGISFNGGTVMLQNSTVANNMAGSNGGGIYDGIPAGMLTIQNSTIANNTSGGGGGGISSTGTLMMSNSTVAGNTVSAGNSNAGAVFSSGIRPVTITNCTITGNKAAGTKSASGIYGPATVSNSIVAANTNNTTQPDVVNAFTSGGYNLIGNVGTATGFTAAGDQKGNSSTPLDPGLDPTGLQSNGGPTQTIALLTTSPAIDAGNTTLTNDQRGYARPVDLPTVANASGGNAADIGAFELDRAQNSADFVVNSPDDHNDGVCGVADCTLREAINAANGTSAPSPITFSSTAFATRKTISLNGRANISSNLSITAPAAGVILSSASANPDTVLQVNSGTVSLSGLTFSGNTSQGLTLSGGTVSVSGCTFQDDADGAIVNNGANNTVNNCTFFNNRAGIRTVSGTVTADSCTFVNSTASAFRLEGGTTSANNCLLAGNAAAVNGGGSLTTNTNGYTSATTTGIVSSAGLADNGGPTKTVALVGGSPAINAGSTALTVDQRAQTRPYGTADDIGAYEVQNTPPTIGTVTITPNPAYTNSTLTANATISDADNDTLTKTYVWKRGATTVQSSTSNTLDLSMANKGDKGDVITVTVTVSDGKDAGTVSATSAPLTISNSAAVVSNVTIDQSNPKTNDTLSFSIGTETDADGDTLTPTYQWKKNDQNILEQTGAILDLSVMGNGDKGDKISVVVTASDGTDSTSSESPQVTIGNTAPVVTTVAITPSAPLTSDTLTANVTATDADVTDGVDTLTYIYVWKKGANVIAGQSSSTLPASQTEDGDSITVTVTANDGTTDSAPVTSDPVTIGNLAPTVDSVSPEGISDALNTKRPFTVAMSDGNGARDIREMWLLINTTLDWSGGATLIYRPSTGDPTSGQLFLRRGDDFLPPITIGTGASSSDILDNGAVRVVGSDVTVSVSGNTITLTLPVTVRDGLVGYNTLFARAQDGAGATDPAALTGEFGFVREGHYTVRSQFAGRVNSLPTLGKLTPGATTTTLNAQGIAPAPQTFGFFAQDPNGIGDIESMWFLAGPTRDWTHSATFVYYPRTRRLVLRSDDGNSFLGGGQIGMPGIIENSQVRVDLSKVKLAIYSDGKTLALSLPLQGKTGLVGKNGVWLRVQDNAGATSPDGDDLGFVRKGNWNVKELKGSEPPPQPSNGNS
ncbi:hypothetical protein IAD21_00642 [Abditibacteriota bacterium]|nr:hypothetical protein IAD21_00642 [Abditibacteriota bacterium]